MRRAWVALLLAGCGFQTRAASSDPLEPTLDASLADATPDGELPGPPICWSIDGNALHVKTCAPTLAMIDLASDVRIDTTPGAANQPLACAPLTSDSTTDACALAANTIRIRAGARLSAQGTRPLALLAHTIDLEGTVDVAAHFGGPPGPGSNPELCTSAAGLQAPTGDGGGQGGTHDNNGGDGGNGGTGAGGHAGDTSALSELFGGCPGWGNAGAAPPAGAGGGGGGAVWIAADTGMLTIAASATINASGAGGPGGVATAGQRGGYGGGAGGLILLQAVNISLDPAAVLFANGGHGGGGAGSGPGAAGTDPDGPTSGGDGGTTGTVSSGHAGKGGSGYPATAPGGDADMANGGGGGGGGQGAVQLFPFQTIKNLTKVSPPLSEP
ncbi:MAG TPA: hypothetical protein VFT22_34370 [Kofleriaceae bacterium]|nr:hypothetical protein [Kofleriaceae bacterium]